jgi:hypothetical protein
MRTDHTLRSVRKGSRILLILFLATGGISLAQDQPLSGEDRGMAKEMLHTVRDDIKKNYYDKKYKGLDIDARFKAAEKKIETAPTMNQALATLPARWMPWVTRTLFSFLPRGPTNIPMDGKCNPLVIQIAL